MKSIPELVLFASATTETEHFRPEAHKVVAGDPLQTLRNHYSDASGQFHAGEWNGEVGEWRVEYSEQEFCLITKGVVKIRSDDGQEYCLKAGDAFVIPSGFKGYWQVIEAVHKYYVIFEPA